MSGSKAEQKAQALLEAARCDAAPISVEQVAKHCGATIRYRDFDGDISGLLMRNDDEVIIGVHAKQPRARQRFTIAHEIGHLCLHKGRPAIVEHLTRTRVNWRDGTSGLATDKEEIEANQFAAALLMPKHLVEDMFWRATPAPESRILRTLADELEVSAQAMRFRLVNLALLDPA